MTLPLADTRAAAAALPAPLVALPAHAAQWQLQLHRAATHLALLEAVPPARMPDDHVKDLEPCGAPLAIAPAPAQSSALPASRTAPADEPLPTNEGTPRDAERLPVRVHVQGLPAEPVQVWLGIDGNATLVAQRVSAAVADLRRNLPSISGGRVASIVCNGVLVYPRATAPAAPLAPVPPLFLKDSP